MRSYLESELLVLSPIFCSTLLLLFPRWRLEGRNEAWSISVSRFSDSHLEHW